MNIPNKYITKNGNVQIKWQMLRDTLIGLRIRQNSFAFKIKYAIIALKIYVYPTFLIEKKSTYRPYIL